jgi:tRNA nucleotidyltransferase (CCA-adding enzyme)
MAQLHNTALLTNDPRTLALKKAFAGSCQLFLVGGCVRDFLRGESPKDLDFTCSLTPLEITKILELNSIYVVPTGLKHQTITAVISETLGAVEITSFRSTGMNPQGGVFLGKTIEEDLSFRDFTINAIAIDCDSQEIIDPYQGAIDLTNKTIRSVGSAYERFREDPLRVLRMVRFFSVLGFEIEEKTFNQSKEFSKQTSQVSPERIRDELAKILTSGLPSSGIRMLREIGLIELILPEVSAMIEFEQNRFHHLNLFDHTMLVLENTSANSNLELRLAALLHDIGKVSTLSIDESSGDRHFYLHEVVGAEMAESLLKRLKFSNQIIEEVVKLVRLHMRPLTAGLGGLRRLLRDVDPLLEIWRELKIADALASTMNKEDLDQQLQSFDSAMEIVKLGPNVSPLKNLALKGQDLIELGLTPGPVFGDILRALHEKVLDDPSLNNKESLLPFAKELAQNSN